MAVDPRGLRQALMARQMALAPEQPDPIDPAVLQGLEGGAPPPDMPIDPPQEPDLGGMPGDMGMAPNVDPAVMLEMEKSKVKEMLKRTRLQEAEAEAGVMMQQRLADIEQEANSLFAPKKKSSGY